MLKNINLRNALLGGLLLFLAACGAPGPSNTTEVAVAAVGGEVPYVVPSRYMRTGHKPVTAAEFERDPFANFESTEARNVPVNLAGLAVGIDNLSLERFVRIVRGEDPEVARQWRDCPEHMVTVPQNLQWFERGRYETRYGVEQCLWLKGPGDRRFKAVFSLGCHNPVGAEITRIVRQLSDSGNERVITRRPPPVEPPVEPPVCEGEDCVEPPVVHPPQGGCNNGWGNNSQCAPGRSLNRNMAENREGNRENGTNNPNGMAGAPAASGTDPGGSGSAPGQQGGTATQDTETVSSNNSNNRGGGNGHGREGAPGQNR